MMAKSPILRNEVNLFDFLANLRFNCDKNKGEWRDEYGFTMDSEENGNWRERVQIDVNFFHCNEQNIKNFHYPCIVVAWIDHEYLDGTLKAEVIYPEDVKEFNHA